jgi:hypothetical protein
MEKGRLTLVGRAKFFIWYSFAACCRQMRLCRWFQWIVFSQISQAKAYVIRLAELARREFDSRKAAAPLQVALAQSTIANNKKTGNASAITKRR